MPEWLVLPPRIADAWGNSLVLEGRTSYIVGVTFSSCGGYLATCASNNETLCVWDLAAGDCILRIPSPERMGVVTVSFSHEHKYIAAVYIGHDFS